MISDLFIQATRSSPEISLAANGRITFSGRCIPQDSDEFFAPVLDWASDYCLEPPEETVIDISIEYINGTNSGKIYRFLKKLKEVTLAGKKMVINFTYEDDDDHTLEYGQSLQVLLEMPFNMKAVEKLSPPVMVNVPPHKSSELTSE